MIDHNFSITGELIGRKFNFNGSAQFEVKAGDDLYHVFSRKYLKNDLGFFNFLNCFLPIPDDDWLGSKSKYHLDMGRLKVGDTVKVRGVLATCGDFKAITLHEWAHNIVKDSGYKPEPLTFDELIHGPER